MNKYFFLLLMLTSATGQVQASEKAPAIKDYPFEKISKNTWVIHGPIVLPNVENQGFMNNPGAVITSAGIVIIDPGSSVQIGEMVLRMTRKISDKPVVAVFNTHIHGDHWFGNQAILEAYPNAKIYGHPKLLAAIEAGEGETWLEMISRATKGANRGTRITPPNHTVDNGDVIKVGNATFRIYHYGIAHTETDIIIEAVEESVVFLGDNVANGRIPRMIDGNFKGNLQTIENILKLKAKTWVPGHGQTNGRPIIVDYQNYLKNLYQAAKKAFNDDLESNEIKPLLMKATSEYKDWSDYNEEIGRHASQVYLEVEAAEF